MNRKRMAISLSCLILQAAGLWAQQTASSGIVGQVNDATQAAVSGAGVTVTNTGTHAVRSAMTDAQGSFSVPNLAPATYEIREREIRLGAEVTEVRAGSVTLADGSRIAAGPIVLATGDAAPRFAPFLPIRPRKGHLAITDRYPGWLRYGVVELGYVKSASGESTESVACNVQPRATGQLLIGSSRQYGPVRARPWC